MTDEQKNDEQAEAEVVVVDADPEEVETTDIKKVFRMTLILDDGQKPTPLMMQEVVFPVRDEAIWESNGSDAVSKSVDDFVARHIKVKVEELAEEEPGGDAA